ncbi:MAG: hypothetical protein CL566_03605 [Alphaproteobacteria bacterium]|nr:hypothetical protein [Alphaproteobacteria bacterium]
MRRILLILAVSTLATIPAAGQAGDVISGHPDATDGATLVFEQDGTTRRVPLAGVSAPPAKAYPFGIWAHLALRDAVAGTEVTCRLAARQTTGHCVAPGLGDLARWAVMNGFAALDPGAAGDPYAAAAREARAARRGIWSDAR